MFNWETLDKPIIALSPMADMTDSAFCLMAKKFGWPVVFREMVSAEALVRASAKTLKMAEFVSAERPIIQQIFGSDPNTMAAAAELIVQKFGPEGIDINMGCPVYKIVSNFNGASLMRDPDLASKIVQAIKARVSVPVSVKIRLGWSDKTDCLDFAKRLEAAGASLLSIHGRTRAQGYSGVADWEMVGQAARGVSIPVLCNGDINTPEKVNEALRISGCAGVLIARGALGCPWFYKNYIDYVAKGKPAPEISLAERIKVVLEHGALHRAQYGDNSIVTFRKHLAWYFKGINQIKTWRQEMMQLTDWQKLTDLLLALESRTDKILND